MLLELLAAALLADGNEQKHIPHKQQNNYFECFEETGSFYDYDGNEHIVDDDNCREDCDDYHDDF